MRRRLTARRLSSAPQVVAEWGVPRWAIRSTICCACVHAGSSLVRCRTIATQSSPCSGLNAVSPTGLPKGPNSRWRQPTGAASADWLSASGLLSRNRGGSQTCHCRARTGMSISGSCDVRDERSERAPSSLPHCKHDAHEPPPGRQFQFDAGIGRGTGSRNLRAIAGAAVGSIDMAPADAVSVVQCARPDRARRRSTRSGTSRRPACGSGREFAPCSRFASKPNVGSSRPAKNRNPTGTTMPRPRAGRFRVKPRCSARIDGCRNDFFDRIVLIGGQFHRGTRQLIRRRSRQLVSRRPRR